MTNEEKKLYGCKLLVELRKKKINDCHILAISNKVDLPFTTMKLAWKNFQETGGKTINKRSSNNNSTGALNIATKTKSMYTKQRPLTTKEAGTIIYEYMTTKLNSREISNKYKIPVQQFYNLISELNTSGTLIGRTILNPKKYAKIEVKNAIWLYKVPNTKRKSIASLTDAERLAYKRVADVLIDYLPHENA